MTVEEIVKSKFEPNEIVDDMKITMLIEEVKYAILNFTYRSEVPEGLKFVWANMVLDYINYLLAMDAEKKAAESDLTDPGNLDLIVGAVSKLKVGDTDFSFESKDTASLFGGASSKSHSVVLDDIVMNYREQLIRYRRIW